MSDLTTDEAAEVMQAAEKAAKIGSSEMTAKVAKLLRQAEGAPEGSPERETFMEKALALSAAYSIDLAIARAHTAKKERAEAPEERQFQTGSYGARYRTKSGSKHMTDLMLAILSANDCKALISSNGVWVWGHGMPSDLDLCERLFVLLSAQMVSEADAALRRGENKEVQRVLITQKVEIPEDEREWGQWNQQRQQYYAEQWDWEEYQKHLRRGGDPDDFWVDSLATGRSIKPFWPPTHKRVPLLNSYGEEQYEEKAVSKVDGRVWRANFYEAFIDRIRVRLRDARKQAMREAGIDMADESDSRAIALRDKKKEVEDSWREHNKTVLANNEKRNRKGYEGAQTSRYDHTARLHGQKKADEARLGNEKDLDHG